MAAVILEQVRGDLVHMEVKYQTVKKRLVQTLHVARGKISDQDNMIMTLREQIRTRGAEGIGEALFAELKRQNQFSKQEEKALFDRLFLPVKAYIDRTPDQMEAILSDPRMLTMQELEACLDNLGI